MRVAIIGGTGFVGSYLVDALVKAGHEPSLLVRPGSAMHLSTTLAFCVKTPVRTKPSRIFSISALSMSLTPQLKKV